MCWLKVALAAVGALVLAEASVQISRISDFPLYDVNNRIGYIPKPNQSGAFLWRNDWVINELSMGTERPFQPSGRTGLLLVGDSLVFGGNPLAQDERLGPALERATNWTVWPISAGSWGLQNQLTYLADHPEVVAGVDRIAFVLNSADFDKPSSFNSDYVTPREVGFPALPYILDRYVMKPTAEGTPPHLLVPPRDAIAMLAAFAARHPADVFLYPTKDELGDGCNWAPKALSAVAGLTIHCVESGWLPHYYRDNIHPSGEGNDALARIMATRL